jgi:hypothetical protein
MVVAAGEQARTTYRAVKIIPFLNGTKIAPKTDGSTTHKNSDIYAYLPVGANLQESTKTVASLELISIAKNTT